MSGHDLIIRGGVVGNAPGGSQGTFDVAVDGGRIAAMEHEIRSDRARTVVDAKGHHVLPGFIDAHVHVSGRFGRSVGYRMLLQSGITCALDLAGNPDDLLRDIPTAGCGISAGVLVPVIPEDTVAGRDPSRADIDELLDRSLARGALGLKALGGHYPITPSALDHVIAACNERRAHCAVHVGSTETGSDVTGLEELVAIAGDRVVQVAHVNSYCRGQVEDPVAEAARAVAALGGAAGAWAESYLAIINAADATCAGGEPVSEVVKTCLRLGGYSPTQPGLERAIDEAWARIHVEDDDGVRLVEPAEGRDVFHARETRVGVSFPVNPPAAALAVALARRSDGHGFVVDGLASDGGSLPRNTTLEQGVGLVAASVMTLPELVEKGSAAPARFMGLTGKGRVEVGADADLLVVDARGRCRAVVIGGQVAYEDGRITELRGGHMLCAPEGTAAAGAAGVPSTVPSSYS